ncbi:hypothetical protein QBC38DRAFT_518589 [Podospora fimiseda]|uniref:Uncharacterized protein n=1 Tax=Podospora fimiseda TaxID=252190 RepID=A0AAN7BFV0_9PEZI|nr:hypothetical protein QBC38DRAFT_518589 [Podospora fimiseda]
MKLFLTITTLLLTALPAIEATTPIAPTLSYIGTANITLSPPIPIGPGPRGNRNFFPITDGSFTGPLFTASIPHYGGDWSLGDPIAGTFYVDARYQLLTDDGANIYVEANGPQQPEEGVVHTRVKFETGDARYYWVNNFVGVGIVTPGEGNEYIVVEMWAVSTQGETHGKRKGKGKGKGRK